MIEFIYKRFLNKTNIKILNRLGVCGFLKLQFGILFNLNFIKLRIDNMTLIKIRPKDKGDLAGLFGFYDEDWFLDIYSLIGNKKVNFFDLGSNIGLTSLKFHKYFDDVNYILVELDINNIELSKFNLKNINGMKYFYNNAIYYLENTRLFFDITSKSNAYSITSGIEVYKESVEVISKSINSLFDGFSDGRCKIVKMDIEGAEKEVFFAAKPDWLYETDLLYLEIHHFNENDIEQLKSILVDHNHELIKSFDYWSSPGWGAFLTKNSKNFI